MNGDSFIGQVGVILGTLLGIVLILYLTYISTKFIGKRYSVKGGGKKIKVIDSVSVSKDSSVMLVKTGGRVFLLGASAGSVNLISELDESEFPETEADIPEGMDFKSALRNVLENKLGRRDKNEKENENDSGQKK